MLPKSKRLTTEAFTRIIEKGQSFHSPFLILRALPTTGSSAFAVSVPKKVAKLAVQRNKIKRRTYSSIKKHNIKQGYAVVLIMKAGIEKLSFKDFESELQKIFVKSSLLK